MSNTSESVLLIALTVVVIVVIPVGAGFVARGKGYNYWLWFFFALLLPCIGVIVVMLLPFCKRCPNCAKRVRQEARACAFCGTSFVPPR